MRGRVKAIRALAIVIAALGIVVCLRAMPERQATRGDCTFLERPEEFLEAQRVRREQAEEQTFRLAARLPSRGTDTGPLVPRNLVDGYIFGKMARDSVAPAALITDAEFLRRVTLDLTGRIPTAADIRAFLQDTRPDKRDKLIDALVGSPEYVDRWTMFFGDLLKNAVITNGSNRYPEGRNAFYLFIKQSVAANKPYNVFATELLRASGNSFEVGPVNYLAGMVAPMGPVQDTWDLSWVNVSQQFLGTNVYDCLFCHDGRGHLDQLNLYGARATRMGAWKLAAFFSRNNLRRVRGLPAGSSVPYLLDDRGTGAYPLNTDSGNRTPRQPVNGQRDVQPEYIYTGQRPSGNFREGLAQFLTSDRQFARAAVNYIWAELMGLGIVDPPDTFDFARLNPNSPPPEPWVVQPTHPELLEALADEFIRSGYNLQHVIKLITKSATYQLSSRYDGDWRESYTTYFARKLVRRLTSEEVHDAIVKATGVPVSYAVTGFTVPFRWAMELPDTTEPRRFSAFLNTFGRGNRDTVARSGEPSIQQGLALMNDPFVVARVRSSSGDAGPNLSRRLASSSAGPRELVDEMFLTVLNRYPSPQEQTTALRHFEGRERVQAIEDLVWVLLNKVDFVFNY